MAVTSTIYTRALAQALEIVGSTEGLTDLLHVPETTLLRWASGRAQTPLRAFLRILALLREHDGAMPATAPSRAVERMVFSTGDVCAQCPRCGGTEFLSVVPQHALRVLSTLQCVSCKHVATYGDVIAVLATLSVKHQRRPRKPVRLQTLSAPASPERSP